MLALFEALEFLDERRALQPEQSVSLSLVATGSHQRALNEIPLDAPGDGSRSIRRVP